MEEKILNAIKCALDQDPVLGKDQNAGKYYIALLELLFAQIESLNNGKREEQIMQEIESSLRLLRRLSADTSSALVVASREQLFAVLAGLFELGISAEARGLVEGVSQAFAACSQHFTAEWPKRSQISQIYTHILAWMIEVKHEKCAYFILDCARGPFEELLVRDAIKLQPFVWELLERVVHTFPFKSTGKLVELIQWIFAKDSTQLSLVLKALGRLCELEGHSEETLTFVKDWICLLADCYTDPQVTFKAELEYFLISSIRLLGARKFFSLLPLNLPGGETSLNSRAWILPIAKEGIQATELNYFFSDFLPSIELLSARAESPNQTVSFVYSLVVNHLWDCLPSFCKDPVDFDSVLLEKIIDLLKARTAPLPSVCNSFNNLIKSRCSLGGKGHEIVTLLFEEYCALPLDSRGFILECIRNILEQIKESSTVTDLLKEGLKNSIAGKADYLDLVLCCSPNINPLNKEALEFTVKYFVSLINDVSTERKAYKGLECLLAVQPTLLSAFHVEFSKILLNNSQITSSHSKCNRLLFLGEIFKSVSLESAEFPIHAVVPEAILATKELNEKARQAAFDLLLTIGIRFRAVERFSDFFQMILAGLAGTSSTMVAASLISIAKITFEFSEQPIETCKILDAVLIFKSSECSNEIIKSSIELIKVLYRSMGEREFLPHLERVCNVLVGWAEGKSAFRTAVKNLIVKFVRNYGADKVQAAVPASYHGVIKHIRKSIARKAKAKEQPSTSANEFHLEEDDEEDYLPEYLQRSLLVHQKSGGELALNAGNTADLNDRKQVFGGISFSSSKQKTTSRPKAQKRPAFNEQEGKMIFDDSEEPQLDQIQEEEPEPQQKRKPQPSKDTSTSKTNQTVAFVPLRSKAAGKKANRYFFAK